MVIIVQKVNSSKPNRNPLYSQFINFSLNCRVRIKYILFLFLFILIGCSEPEPRPDGPYKEYYKNGQVSEEGTIKDGLWNGTHKSYHENGQLSKEGTLKNSGWDGPYKSYYDNGELFEDAISKDGLWNGSYKSYTQNGQIIQEGIYKDGEYSGLYREFYDNGELKLDTNSKDDYLDGPYKLYSENGILEEVGIYKNGDVIEFTPIKDFSGTWRYKDTYNNATLIIDGNTYTLREVLMGSTVTNDEGSLEIFTTTTTNEFNDEIIIQGIRLLNSSRKPKFWLDTNRGTLSVPWRYMGSSRYVNQSYYSEYLFYKE